MALPEQERLHFAGLSHRSSLSDCLTGMEIRSPGHLYETAALSFSRYPQSRLLEINSHSLFSRWFSESGKLVQKLFSSVMELVEDEDTFVVVLIGFLAFSSTTNRPLPP